MKKFLILFLILLLTTGTTGCSASNTASEKEQVKINMPEDNTVNGYRLEASQAEISDDSAITADKVTVESGTKTATDNTESTKIMYCANISSKVFHKSDCGSVKNMKEENKFYLSDRAQLIEDGYTPCKQCNP